MNATRFKRTTGAVLTTIVSAGLVLTGISGAQASAPPSGDDADLIAIGTSGDIEAYQGLTAAEQERYAELSQVADIEVVDELIPGSEKTVTMSKPGFGTLAIVCRNYTRTWTSSNSTGNQLYSYWLQLQVCGNNSLSSYAVLSQGGNTSWVGWTYEGIVGSSSGIVSGEAHSYAQYHFRLAILQVGTIQDTYPCGSLDSSGINSFGNMVIKATPTARCGL